MVGAPRFVTEGSWVRDPVSIIHKTTSCQCIAEPNALFLATSSEQGI